MYKENAISFARGHEKEPTVKKCVKEILWPLLLGWFEMGVFATVGGSYRYLVLVLLIIVAVYLILTLKTLSWITLERYLFVLSLVCSMWLLAFIVLEYFLICIEWEAPFSLFLTSCISLLVSPVITVCHSHLILKRKVKFVAKPLSRFAIALIAAVPAFRYFYSKYNDPILTSTLSGSWFACFLMNYFLALGVTVSLRRLYFAKKYKVDFDHSSDK